MQLKIHFALSLLLGSSIACGYLSNLSESNPAPSPVVITQVVVVTQAAQATPDPPVDLGTTMTPTPTETTTSTATSSLTATPSGPVATFIKNANCRAGPGTNYEAVTSFVSGQTVEIVGRNPDFNNTWWYVKIPESNGRCWVSLTTAQAFGDFDAIPTVKP